MSRIADVLRSKGNQVATVSPTTSVSELVAVLVERGIGAVVVTDDVGAVVGIVSERDVVRRVHSDGPELLGVPVRAIMTADVVTCVPGDEVDTLMRTMTDRRIRHLPVVVDDRLSGIVSIGDLVKARIGELEQEREHLHQYLAAGS